MPLIPSTSIAAHGRLVGADVGEGEEEPATAAHDASSVRTTSAVGVEPYREVSAARDPDSIIARLFAARRSFPERARRERNGADEQLRTRK